jgi:hypothetical protein
MAKANSYDASEIERVMAEAVLLANAEGITDPAQISARMDQRRGQYLKACDDRAVLDKIEAAEAEAAKARAKTDS